MVDDRWLQTTETGVEILHFASYIVQAERKGPTLHGRSLLLFEFRSSRSTPFRDETEAGEAGTLIALQGFCS
jgi:hypothetical protein